MVSSEETASHPIQRAWRARELLRLRSSSDRLRAGAALRAGRIDPNPHQIEAVRFALERLPEGGAILADEVGLGKTIEAGLVCAQLLAEGPKRILLLAPKPLIGQWRQELESLFGLRAREGLEAWGAPGMFAVGREAATSPKALERLGGGPDPDLVIVDEAHEIFSGLHQRFDKHGQYRADHRKAGRAGALYELLRASDAPVLLLTATPVQNRLVELWSLVQYIDRTSTTLGPLPTFRALFSADSQDRTLRDSAEPELRRRLGEVVQRTLRRQAQEFLPQPFVDRHAKTFSYRLSDEEQALSDDVTDYLLTPRLAAFSGRSRKLLLIGFHRRMASSRDALAKSLGQVEARLENLLDGKKAGKAVDFESDAKAVAEDLEDEDLVSEDPGPEDEAPMSPEEIVAELERVRALSARAKELTRDAKLEALIQAARSVVVERGGGEGSGKMVVFTESLATQAYLRDALLKAGFLEPGDITLFNGSNDGARAKEALERWRAETQEGVPAAERPSLDVAVRLALVHELRTRSKVFISSEAGAKGLNLQFCETVVNYDLPWNPQRIEQRIGRCHRYGQTRSVTVINFLAENNEAETLLFDILQTKLSLFDQVLGSSDQILGDGLASALGPDLEATLREIHERARTREEIVAALRDLRDSIGEKREAFESAHRQTAGLIESTFDDDLKRIFRGHEEALGNSLEQLDHEMRGVLEDYLSALGLSASEVREESGPYLVVPAASALPEGFREGFELGLGRSQGRPALHLGHPLLAAALEEGTAALEAAVPHAVSVTPLGDEWDAMRGRKGRATVVWVRVDGFEQVDLFVPVVLLEGEEEPLPPERARALLTAPMRTVEPSGAAYDELTFEDVIEEELHDLGLPVDDENRSRFRKRMSRLERSMDDRCRVLGASLRELDARTEGVRAERDSTSGSEPRAALDARIAKMELELEALRASLDRLRAREDEDYQRLRDRDLRRRYLPPTPRRLFDVELFVR